LEADATLNDESFYSNLFAEMNARITRYNLILEQEKGRRNKEIEN
jgi:hypothetical protein